MKVKIFRLDSRNGFEDWLSAAKDNRKSGNNETRRTQPA